MYKFFTIVMYDLFGYAVLFKVGLESDAGLASAFGRECKYQSGMYVEYE